MGHTKPHSSSSHQSQLATMDAHFSTQTDFFLPRDSHSATFQTLVKGAGIANIIARTTPFLLPSPKSTTPMAANSQNRAPKPHVAAIVQNDNNNDNK